MYYLYGMIGICLLGSLSVEASASTPTPAQALTRLVEGNSHFVAGKMEHTCYLTEAKNKLLEQQRPFAAIVGCSDSRVPPELIFDRGLGELFVVRDAGNVIGPVELDSVEFAAAKLEVPLIVVMGHQDCGAVQAALGKPELVPELDTIFPMIDASLKKCKKGSDRLKEAIFCNVRAGVETIRKSPTIAPLIADKKVQVIGAYFDFSSGKVSWVPEK